VIRFCWLQNRALILLGAAGLAAFAIVTGALRGNEELRLWSGVLVVAVPAVVGMFWGAPLLSREVQTGTFQLAWTQSVTRTRWTAVHLAVLGLAGTALAGLLSLYVTWWAGPLDRAAANRFGTFDERHLVPVGHAALAFALGVTAGVLIRRTLPAMAATLAAFVAARLTMAHSIRPDLLAAERLDRPLDPVSTGYGGNPFGASTLQPVPPRIPNAWITSTRIVDDAGHPLTTGVLASTCPDLGGGPRLSGGHQRAPQSVVDTLHDCVVRIGAGYHEAVTFQPAHRYWTLQWYELAICLCVAIGLGAFSIWWVRRRLL
jgi:hypothetical protein